MCSYTLKLAMRVDEQSDQIAISSTMLETRTRYLKGTFTFGGNKICGCIPLQLEFVQ